MARAVGLLFTVLIIEVYSFQLLLPVLDEHEDLVVRLSAAKALKVVIDDFEFSSEEMKPYLNNAFERLFKLLKEVEECDTKVESNLEFLLASN